jgi:glycosyltransferase involved in cell wall biosynthesis
VRLYVAGLALRGDGYPNAARTLALLRETTNIEVIECGRWLPESMHLWKLARISRWRAGWCLLELITGNLLSLIRVMHRIRRMPAQVYVPYPGIFFLGWVSLLPHRWRPRCIADTYISIWDSLIRDRGNARQGSWTSRGIKWLERRALQAAELVLVDTQANREFLVEAFELDAKRVRSLPLAIEERYFTSSTQAVRTDGGRLRVLFVGTLIPLHGVPTILDAMRELLSDPRFEFRIVGDGQLAGQVEKFVFEHPSAAITWVREWCSLDRIASEVAAADICLGVFGGEQKAARVLPFKLYMYFASGRPVISQSKLSTPAGVPSPPIEAISPGDAADLVEAICRLGSDASLRQQLADASGTYYRTWLANSCVSEAWQHLLG